MTKYRPFLILLAITILSYLLVSIFYRVLGAHLERIPGEERASIEKTLPPKAPEKPPMDFYAMISERNLFGTTGKVILKGQIDIDTLEPTKLTLTLLGTVAGGQGFDYAVIEEADKKKQGLFRVGDTVASATIVKIMRGMVVLRVEDKDEILSMEEKTGTDEQGAEKPASQTGSAVVVRKTEIDEALTDMGQLLAQARIQPFFSGGKSSGFIISRIKKGSIFQKMGMQNGDIIQGVNGQPIQSPDEMMELYNGLKSGSAISLRIKRRGKEQDLKYAFE